MKENIIKAALMFGGGFLLFWLVRPKDTATLTAATVATKTSADGSKSLVDTKNAELAANAYSMALKSGETPQRLTELNKELLKEFNVRCYVSDDNKIKVCDTYGNTIFTK